MHSIWVLMRLLNNIKLNLSNLTSPQMKLFYREFGAGSETIIIVHGLYGSSDNWATIARELGEKFRVIAIDCRNHGKSPHSTSHTYKDMADDLVELMDDLHISKSSFIGHSMGGKSVMQMALSYPERVKKIAVLDIAPKSYASFHNYGTFTNNHPAILQAMSEIDFTNITTRGEIEQFLKDKIKDESVTNFLLKNIARTHEGNFHWKLNVTALQNNLEEILDGFSQPLNLPNKPFTGDVLFLRGEKSSYFADEDLHLARKLFPRAELSTIPNAAHWLHAEQPKLVTNSLLYFFE